MQTLPHYYSVTATGGTQGDTELKTDRVAVLGSDSPAEFDGPGDRWSPETLLAGAVGDCLILTFRAVARASKLDWTSLRCEVTGTLDRVDRVTQFTRFEIHAHLTVPSGVDRDLAQRTLDKAERGCLITNSLKASVHLAADIEIAGERAPAYA